MDAPAFTYPFCYTPRPEIVAASRRLIARIAADPALHARFAEGKMLGVLEVETPSGETEFLYGFSGLAGGSNRVEGFVPPIFDLLDPQGHFKQEEAAIVALTREIRACLSAQSPCLAEPPSCQAEPGEASETRLTELKRERRERSVALQEWLFDQYIVCNARGERSSIAEIFAREGRVPPAGTGECAAPKLLQFAYRNGLKPIAMGEFWYGAAPASGEVRRSGSFYPACTGKCGPLLGYMLEGLYVEPDPLSPIPAAGVQNGLNRTPIPIIFEDEALLVIDKPSGLLSVPGRRHPDSAQSLLERAHGPLFPCHRLDMDTSGLQVFAKTPADQAAVQAQFAARSVRKSYRAVLMAGDAPDAGDAAGPFANDGGSQAWGEGSGKASVSGDSAAPGRADATTLLPGAHGWIDLPLASDWYDRPRQKVDRTDGRPALTEYEILAVHPGGEIEVRFTPHTGRTHQLRVHAAHPDGLGRPILGDRLYGGHPAIGMTDADAAAAASLPLQLRADRLSFRHPRTGALLSFSL